MPTFDAIAVYFDGTQLCLDRPELPLATKEQFQMYHTDLIRPQTLIRLQEDIYLLGQDDRLSTVT